MEFETLRTTWQPKIEQTLREMVQEHVSNLTLQESMLYSLTAGGKRIRPLLVLATIDFFGQPITESAIEASCCLEMIHTYSLIHDDLPCIDDDDLRRGKPTNHVVYGEAIATLAGDALLTDAFYFLSELKIPAEQRIQLVGLLANAAGSQGMVAGQVDDLLGENQSLSLEQIQHIHEQKTGALIAYAVQAGAILSGHVRDLAILNHYAHHFGLAFQIRDDILDVTATAEEIGKTPGKDEHEGKSTYPSQVGLGESYHLLAQEIRDGLRDLSYLEVRDDAVEHTALGSLIQQLNLNEGN